MKTEKNLKLQKIIKIVIINLLTFCLLDSILTFVDFNNLVVEQKGSIVNPFKTMNFDKFYKKKVTFKNTQGLKYKKKPILLFGCSYTYGLGLEENQTFYYKISHFSKRPVYNRAFWGWGVQHMLYQLRQDSLYKEIPEPEVIIYTFINDQAQRLYLDTLWFPNDNIEFLRYQEKRGQLIKKTTKIFPIREFHIIYKIKHKIALEKAYNNYCFNKSFDFLKQYFIESKKEINKHWPKTKIIILIYNMDKTYPYTNTPRWKELEKEGFIVVNTKDLVHVDLNKAQYRTHDYHPTEKAWDLLVPKLVKKINL